MTKTPAPLNVRDDLTGYGQNGDDTPSAIMPGERVTSDLADDLESTAADDVLASVRAGNAPNDQTRDVGSGNVPVHPAMAGPGYAEG